MVTKIIRTTRRDSKPLKNLKPNTLVVITKHEKMIPIFLRATPTRCIYWN